MIKDETISFALSVWLSTSGPRENAMYRWHGCDQLRGHVIVRNGML